MLKWILVILVSGTVSACGYHLSGSQTGGQKQLSESQVLAPQFNRVSLRGIGKFESLRHVLVTLLRSHGVRITRSKSAAAQITIIDKEMQDRAAAIGDDAKASEYLLTVNVAFTVKIGKIGSESAISFPDQAMQASASYLYSPDELLSSQNERRRALDDIENRLARQVFDRLVAMSTPLREQTDKTKK